MLRIQDLCVIIVILLTIWQNIVFLVAELGVNWNGDFELVQKMMLNAKTLGCNTVKFQAFNEYRLSKQHLVYNYYIRGTIFSK